MPPFSRHQKPCSSTAFVSFYRLISTKSSHLISHESHPPVHDNVKRRRQCGCGRQILHALGGSLRRLHESKWIGCFQDDKRSRHQSGLFHDLEGIQISEKVGGDNPRIFSYAELYIGSKGFCEDEVLGSGGFGKVYRAVLPSDGTVVAVKCLAERGEQFEKTFEAELVAKVAGKLETRTPSLGTKEEDSQRLGGGVALSPRTIGDSDHSPGCEDEQCHARLALQCPTR
ncbi:hypothetical protein OIU84_028213 [Salix udensis]|uniref:non-specific serine/threonine protein kinase n=1 Tax=Salix udensis TaxID=889485 RepID=A0AAD6KCA4_9ROSI|nr:hypothetical protein OIU84_028213 [Salix udensis]